MAIKLADLPPHVQKQVLKVIAEEDARRTKSSDKDPFRLEKKPSKYHSQKISFSMPDGTNHTFDSLKEADRFNELSIMQKAGEISDLEIQKEYVLLPKQKAPDGKTVREVKYYADFVYRKADGTLVVEDVKSPATKTQVYRLKKKLMLYFHGIDIVEI